VVRVSSRVVTVLDQIYQLRYLLAAILALGILAGLGLGSYLALSIERPIKRVAHSIQELAAGDRQVQVEEQGPEEIRSLAHSFNVLVIRLNSLEQARRQLLANLVHELGRPLGAIRSAIQALINGAMDDQQLSGDLLSGLDGETLRLQRLLEDLAGLHDQVLGSLELNRKPLKLQDWLLEIVSPWEAAAREKGLSWRLEVEQDLPEIELDPDRMAQALGNLLSNAVKFTPAGGQVAISVHRMEKELVMEVEDSGPGIPQGEQEKVFQPFYRGSQGRRIVQGMGLGLSIVRQVAEAHGGQIEVESQPGKGSCFRLRLPM
jgi:signal transduction histidine kinase